MRKSVWLQAVWCIIAINFGWAVLRYPIAAQIFVLAVGFLVLTNFALDVGNDIVQKFRGKRFFGEKSDVD